MNDKENLLVFLDSITQSKWCPLPSFHRHAVPLSVCFFGQGQPEFYAPQSPSYIHPQELEQIFKKAAEQSQFILPSVEIDLGGLPSWRVKRTLGTVTAIGELNVNGSINIRNVRSQVDWTLNATELHHLQFEGEVVANNILSSFYISHGIISPGRACISSNIAGDFWATTLSITGNSFSATATPKPISFNYLDFVIEGELGYELKGSIYNTPNIPSMIFHQAFKSLESYAMPSSVVMFILKAGEFIGERLIPDVAIGILATP